MRRRWALALTIGITGALVAGTTVFFVMPRGKYEAQAVLLVAAQPPTVLFRTFETQGAGGDDYKRYQKTQVASIRTRLVLNTALKPEFRNYEIFKGQKDPVNWLKENLDVSFPEGVELLTIGLKGDNAAEVANVVNAVTDAYQEEVVDREHKKRQERSDMLQSLKTTYSEDLKAQRKHVRDLAESAGSGDRETLAKKQQFAMEHLATIQKELLSIQAQKRKAQAEFVILKQLDDGQPQIASGVSAAEITRVVESDPVVIQLEQQLADAQSRLAKSEAFVAQVARKPGDLSLKRLRQEVETGRHALEQRRTALVPEVTQQLQEIGHTSPGRARDIEQELAILSELEQRIQAEIDQVNVGNQTLTVRTLDLESLQDEALEKQNAATKINGEIEALSVELKAPPRIQVLEKAEIPRDRDDKKKYMMVGGASLATFGLSLFGMAFWEFRARKVDSVEIVSSGLGLHVVGALPILPKPTRGRLAHQQKSLGPYWQNVMLESIDTIRTFLLHAAEVGSSRVIMITSPLSGEGKTSVSCHLATSLARAGRRVLLVDADLRRPSIQRLFALAPSAGLSEVLRDEVSVEAAIVASAVPNLAILQAGSCDDRTIQALARGGIKPVFARLKDQYEFVIVDTSPILPVTDGLLIAREVDAVIFSVLREVSRLPKIFAAYQRLATLGTRILGAVVTGTDGGLYGANDYEYVQRTRSKNVPGPQGPWNNS